MTAQEQFSTFTVAGLLFGIAVEKVQEVIRYQEMTRVPLAPPLVRGLINLRGQIVTALDLRRRLGLGEAPPDHRPMNVVVRDEGGGVSLLVDEIGDVVEVEDASFEPPPQTLAAGVRGLIRGVHKLDTQLLHVLDTDRVLEAVGCG